MSGSPREQETSEEAHGPAQPKEPPLRLAGGDVIVKLSSDPNDWLLLHSYILLEHMHGLGSNFNGFRTTGYLLVEDPVTKAHKTIFFSRSRYKGKNKSSFSNRRPIPRRRTSLHVKHFSHSGTLDSRRLLAQPQSTISTRLHTHIPAPRTKQAFLSYPTT